MFGFGCFMERVVHLNDGQGFHKEGGTTRRLPLDDTAEKRARFLLNRQDVAVVTRGDDRFLNRFQVIR